MNKEEFIEKYGEVKVKFDFYFKYTFYFKGILENGNSILCSFGGTADSIFKFGISSEEISITDLNPIAAEISYDNIVLAGYSTN